MPVPPVGNVVTPVNFTVTSAQSLVLLNWTPTPLTTTYYINRSVDNVTFTNIDNIPALPNVAQPQYADTTGVPNQIYYYTVQASDGISSSLPTVSLSARSLYPGQTTVANLRLECQQRTDRVNSDNITNQEWNSMISNSNKELYDILIQKFGCDYKIAPPFYYTTTGLVDPLTQSQTYPLPRDFYKLMRVEVAINAVDPRLTATTTGQSYVIYQLGTATTAQWVTAGVPVGVTPVVGLPFVAAATGTIGGGAIVFNSINTGANTWVTMKQFQAVQANLYNFPNIYTLWGVTNLQYRLWGNNIQIVPIASAGQLLRIWYSPKPDQLLYDTDITDAISGWEEYVVADVCIKALAKTEEDVSIFGAQKMALLKRIEEAAENRNVGEPQTVSDSRHRNFSWGDGHSGPGVGGMW